MSEQEQKRRSSPMSHADDFAARAFYALEHELEELRRQFSRRIELILEGQRTHLRGLANEMVAEVVQDAANEHKPTD